MILVLLLYCISQADKTVVYLVVRYQMSERRLYINARTFASHMTQRFSRCYFPQGLGLESHSLHLKLHLVFSKSK